MAYDIEGLYLGTCAVGAPVRDQLGDVAATISVVMPTGRFGPAERELCTEAVKSGRGFASRPTSAGTRSRCQLDETVVGLSRHASRVVKTAGPGPADRERTTIEMADEERKKVDVSVDKVTIKNLAMGGLLGGGGECFVDVKDGKAVRIRPLQVRLEVRLRDASTPWKIERNGKTLEPAAEGAAGSLLASPTRSGPTPPTASSTP